MRIAIPVLDPGTWSADGAHVASDGVTLACRHGVIAKCALCGYAPWTVGEALHAAARGWRAPTTAATAARGRATAR